MISVIGGLLNAPNLFTLLRLLLTPFVAAAILNGQHGRAITLFFIAGASDAIDGFLARRLGSSTRVGAYFDPIADKILLVAIYLALGWVHAIPRWMVALVFARDLLILAMAAYGLRSPPFGNSRRRSGARSARSCRSRRRWR